MLAATSDPSRPREVWSHEHSMFMGVGNDGGLPDRLDVRMDRAGFTLAWQSKRLLQGSRVMIARERARIVPDGHGGVRGTTRRMIITDDPLHLRFAGDDLYVDLAAERLIAAEKGLRRIAVEIKSFNGPSEIVDLHAAVGQFVVYREVLAEVDPTRELYLAVSEAVRDEVFSTGVARLLLARQIHNLVSYDPERKEIVRWIPSTVTEPR